MKKAKRIFWVAAIWLAFLLAAIAGFVVGLLLLLFGRTEFAERNFKAQNKAAATLLGFEGSQGVSRSCGENPSRVCQALCAFLSWALDDPEHCRKQD
jgi:hypothetical protein